MTKLTTLLIFLFTFFCYGIAQTANDREENIKGLVVMLTAEIEGTPSIGAGIVFDFDADRNRLYIVTADHVVRRGDIEADSINVEFWQLPGEEYEANLLRPLETTQDMAVVSLRTDEFGLTQSDFSFEALVGGNADESREFTSVGQGSGRSWVTLKEPTNLRRGPGGLLELQAEGVTPGDSGGGVFSETGKLLGMIVRDAPPYLEAISTATLLSELEVNRYDITIQEPPADTNELVKPLTDDAASANETNEAPDLTVPNTNTASADEFATALEEMKSNPASDSASEISPNDPESNLDENRTNSVDSSGNSETSSEPSSVDPRPDTEATAVPLSCSRNDSFQCAALLQLGGSDSDEFGGIGDDRYYSLEVRQPNSVAIALNPVPATRGVDIVVYNDKYAQISDREFPRGTPGVFDVNFRSAGTYFIVLFPENCCNGAPFNYTISLERKSAD